LQLKIDLAVGIERLWNDAIARAPFSIGRIENGSPGARGNRNGSANEIVSEMKNDERVAIFVPAMHGENVAAGVYRGFDAGQIQIRERRDFPAEAQQLTMNIPERLVTAASAQVPV